MSECEFLFVCVCVHACDIVCAAVCVFFVWV